MLRVQIETMTDLNEIKEAAESRLGMQMPDKSQIVYIRVPRNDYTVMVSREPETDNYGNPVLKFINRAVGLFKLFE